MHLSLNSVQPFMEWVQVHPKLALLLTFLISFAESLAVIGSIVPGSVMMTAVGMLAGAGVMRIDLTFLCAILGAIAGDWGSYFLGYALSDRLDQMWPFKRYPQWLAHGRRFFERHGGKSVFLGRFIGPLRSIIPVIAGMLKMGHYQFLMANVISAIAWSIIYVGPGILIGTASVDLAAQYGPHLMLAILFLLCLLWVFARIIKLCFPSKTSLD